MVLRLIIFLMAGVAASGAAWLTLNTGPAEPPPPPETQGEKIPMQNVLVAATDIPSGEVLSPDKVLWQPWPVNNLNDRFITREARPNAIEELSGTFVNSAFAAGEPISEARLMATNMNLLSSKIAPGMRAVAVKVSAESTAGGFILPGDRVDVIQTQTIAGPGAEAARNESRIIIPNVRVLAIDQTAVQSPEGSVLGKTATIELTPVQAERIMAAEASGRLSLALRSVSDHADTDPVPVEPERTVTVHRAAETSTVTIR